MNGSPNCRHSRACAKSALAGILPPRLNKAFAEQFLQATTFAGIAQLVEHLICNQEVRGSNPCVGTIHSKVFGGMCRQLFLKLYKFSTVRHLSCVGT